LPGGNRQGNIQGGGKKAQKQIQGSKPWRGASANYILKDFEQKGLKEKGGEGKGSNPIKTADSCEKSVLTLALMTTVVSTGGGSRGKNKQVKNKSVRQENQTAIMCNPLWEGNLSIWVIYEGRGVRAKRSLKRKNREVKERNKTQMSKERGFQDSLANSRCPRCSHYRRRGGEEGNKHPAAKRKKVENGLQKKEDQKQEANGKNGLKPES